MMRNAYSLEISISLTIVQHMLLLMKRVSKHITVSINENLIKLLPERHHLNRHRQIPD